MFLIILSVGLSDCYVTAEKVKMFRNFSEKGPLRTGRRIFKEGQSRWCPSSRLGSGCFGEGINAVHWS